MKAIDILCASPASTAISPSLEQIRVVRQGRQSWLKERQGSTALEPSNQGRQSWLKERQGSTALEPSNPLTEEIGRERPRRSTERRTSNAGQNARGIEPSPRGIEEKARRSTHRRSSNAISRFSCSAIDQLAIVPYQSSPARKVVKKCPVVNNIDPSSSSTDAAEVVVLRVSLHCQGCAGKVRKHISKMKGVTSFSIDLPKQKVTVVGNVMPLEVLQSISRVKNAEFWSTSQDN